ncbi:MAG: hypothetical protein ACK4E0_06965 [Chitinophagaceae bacterium]
MQLDHIDYIKLVTQSYYRKRDSNELSLLLTKPTPAKIRQACVHTYRERYNPKDEKALTDFFGPAAPGKKFIELMEATEADRFKPLDNYLKGNTEKTDDRNLELLAWLIDFPHRPHRFQKMTLLSEEERKILDKEEAGINEIASTFSVAAVNPVAPALAPATKKGLKKSWLILLLAILSGTVYWYWQERDSNEQSFGAMLTGCMYWQDDRYVQSPCNEEQKGRLLLPLNSGRMESFRRITREDTITARSIGKVHYIKRNGTIEYYTQAGQHPIEVTKKLHPLTWYMYNKYLRSGQTAK